MRSAPQSPRHAACTRHVYPSEKSCTSPPSPVCSTPRSARNGTPNCGVTSIAFSASVTRRSPESRLDRKKGKGKREKGKGKREKGKGKREKEKRRDPRRSRIIR